MMVGTDQIRKSPYPNTLHAQKWASASWQTERDAWTSKTAYLPGTNISVASMAEWKFSISILYSSTWQEPETPFPVCRASQFGLNYMETIEK